jgi:hypothetical protein
LYYETKDRGYQVKEEPLKTKVCPFGRATLLLLIYGIASDRPDKASLATNCLTDNEAPAKRSCHAALERRVY